MERLDRLAVTILVWALLVATTAAFVVTEALKLERPPAGAFRGDRAFAPTCSCPREVARMSFRLRKAAAIDVLVVGVEGDPVRTLASGARPGKGRVDVRWDGRDDAGDIAPDGRYRLRVRLAGEGEAVTLRRGVILDTKPPELELLGVEPTRIEGEPGQVSIRLRVNEPARVVLRVDGRPAARLGPVGAGSGQVAWPGTQRGRALPPGSYEVGLVARDRAGNRSVPTRSVDVTVVSSAG